MNIDSIDLLDLALPVSLRSSALQSDHQLMHLAEQHHPCKVERNRNGEITIMTPVGGIGSTHEIFVASALFQWTETQGSGIAFGSAAGFNLPDSSCLSPAAAWLSLARWNALTLEQQAGFPPLCPEFVIEIRSRSDLRATLETKMLRWLENGSKLAWLLDPTAAEAVVYRPNHPTQTLTRPEFLSGHDSVAGFEFHASRLWLPLA